MGNLGKILTVGAIAVVFSSCGDANHDAGAASPAAWTGGIARPTNFEPELVIELGKTTDGESALQICAGFEKESSHILGARMILWVSGDMCRLANVPQFGGLFLKLRNPHRPDRSTPKGRKVFTTLHSDWALGRADFDGRSQSVKVVLCEGPFKNACDLHYDVEKGTLSVR